MRIQKKLIVIILVAILCISPCVIYYAANRIFPIDYDKIITITVENEKTKSDANSCRHRRLHGWEMNKLIKNINKLEPVKKEKIGHVIETEILNEVHYSVRVIYDPIDNPFRKEPAAWLYFFDDGKILVDYNGYTFYQQSGEYYEDFLDSLEETHMLCSVNE